MPSYVRVTNLSTHKSLIVRVNDRGPYHANREIDLSARAADLLGFRNHGTARVRVEYVGAAPIEGTDDRQLMATLRHGQPAPSPVMVASNRFLPNFSRPVRGAPLPQERPFDLGERNDRVAMESYPQLRSTSDARVLASEALARHQANPRVADVSPDTATPRHMAARLRAAEARGLPPSTEVTGARTGGPWAAQPPAVSPVSAYAPVRFDGSQAVSSGRGLY
jgi:peptidoglycan lytic transglycosylase